MLSVLAHETGNISPPPHLFGLDVFAHKAHLALFHGPLAVIDLRITDYINRLIPRNIFMDEFFSLLSFRGNYRLIAVLLAAFIVINFGQKLGRKIWAFVLAVSISALTVEFLLKSFFHRIRPYFVVERLIPESICPNDYSFPSGHATVAFALATVASGYDKKRAKLYYFLAFMISLSRVYLGCHYFMDIVIGAILGLFVGRLLRSFFS